MIREESSPGSGSPRTAASFGWLLPAAVTAVATAVAVVTVPTPARVPVVVIGAIATIAVAVIGFEVYRRGKAIEALRRTVRERDTILARHASETAHLAGSLLPDAMDRLHRGEFPEDVLSSVSASEAHRAVVQAVVGAVVSEEELRESAQRAFVNISRRVQAIVHQQAKELREMEDRHGKSPEVFGDLLRLDHGTALIGRLADSIAVLGGARPGRQWGRAVPLYSVLRGAMSRIIDYQRVELHTVSEVAVVGPAVEPLIHALAELLDNATRYSPPQTKVHLTAMDVQSGIAIEIEDGGVNMSEETRRRAEQVLRQAQQGIDLNDLGETPRLGLAVVGRLAQAYGFQVSLRSSAYGGVRAVVVMPQEMITGVESATGIAHGIGAASLPRTTLPPAASRTAPAPAAPFVPGQRHEPQAYTQAEAYPQAQAYTQAQAYPQAEAYSQVEAYSQPHAQPRPAPDPLPSDISPMPPDGTIVSPPSGRVVTEWTPNGLPQRRRKSRLVAAPDPAAPAATGGPYGRDSVPDPAAPVPDSSAYVPTSAPDHEPTPQVQPGMWLAAFQSGLSGESTDASKGNTQP
ncbi:ATP-binding protein [Streptomyces sp. NPDC127084]|uniref:sensor histidine kinase n=1 Tax=Streptomyces sp. NPDC127084 TaxID=3347133 RepID=UPI0036510A71